MKTLIASLPILVAISAMGVSSAYAFTKIYKELPAQNQEVVEIGEMTGNEGSDEISQVPVDNSSAVTTTNSKTNPTPTKSTNQITTTTNTLAKVQTTSTGASTGSANGSFTLATLASHNKPGDCYIAYSGTVYDVSGQQAWAGCTHHGATGGADITSRFPHPTSYLASLPVVGTLSGGTVGSQTGTTTGSRLEKNDEDEHREDHDAEEEHETESEEHVEIEQEQH